jgi:general secretion pathway protein N
LIRVLTIVFAVVLVAALVAFMPMRAAAGLIGLDRLGLSAAAVSGTVWSGRLQGAAFRGTPLGEVAVGVDPLALFTGTTRLRLRAAGGRAVLVRSGSRVGLVDADLQAPLALFPTAVPLPGTLTTQDLTAGFQRGRCVRAEGKVSADVLQRNGDLLGEGGSLLTGDAVCDGGALVLPLRGRTQSANVELTLRIESDGRYRMDTKVDTADPRLQSTLSLAGFVPAAGGRARTDQGRLWR